MDVKTAAVIAALVFLSGGKVSAMEFSVASIFCDHMLLQRDQAIRVWGTADPGRQVQVSLAGHEATAEADKTGHWMASLPALPAGGPHEMEITGSETKTIRDILVGDVWLCSGQSNMETGLGAMPEGPEEIEKAIHPNIRLLHVPNEATNSPQANAAMLWLPCSPHSMRLGAWQGFSAIAYYFGRELHEHLDVPIGLIDSTWSGSPCEAWTPRAVLEADPELKYLMHRSRKRPPDHEKAPGSIYNGMIHPLIPYGIKGVIWYQGESNVRDGKNYAEILSTMIKAWRERWQLGPFPFLIVQLPNFDPNPQTNPSIWATTRDAQRIVADSTENAGLVTTIDIGEARDIHPLNKRTVAQRLVLQARKVAYGEDIPCSGPVYKAIDIRGRKVTIRFNHVYGGLKCPDDAINNFAVAGADKEFYPAKAVLKDNKVVVSSWKVKHPVAVRYAWSDNPENCNLYNKAGLPAVPFRTDDWTR